MLFPFKNSSADFDNRKESRAPIRIVELAIRSGRNDNDNNKKKKKKKKKKREKQRRNKESSQRLRIGDLDGAAQTECCRRRRRQPRRRWLESSGFWQARVDFFMRSQIGVKWRIKEAGANSHKANNTPWQ